jgi:hypothetical protein
MEAVMIEANEAVKIAIKYIKDLYESTGFIIQNILLEELTLDDYKNIPDCWFVTIGFNEDKRKKYDSISIINRFNDPTLLHSGVRKFKSIIIDPNGNVMGLKIHEVEYAR